MGTQARSRSGLINPHMNTLLAIALISGLFVGDRASVLIVQGASGAPEYDQPFHESVARWQSAANSGNATPIVIGGDPSGSDDLTQLQTTLANLPKDGSSALWIVLIGHGTFDGREAKFNLTGTDLSDVQLAEWLKPFTRPMAIIDCSSCSGPFINRLSANGRVVITATRSGSEQNATRLGQFLSQAIADPTADLDKDGQVSLLEAFLAANGRVEEFYREGARLATEHALLDDNGDGLGTQADWYRGVHATKRAKAGASADGTRAHQFHLIPGDRDRALSPESLRRRDELELAIAALREQKPKLTEDDYYAALELLLIELGKLYRDSLSPVESAPRPPRLR
jgi:hypothetical protein